MSRCSSFSGDSGAIPIRCRFWSQPCGALSSFYHDSLDITDPVHRELSALRLLAKMPTLVAMSYKYNVGQPFVYPRKDLYYTANFMRMMFATPAEDYQINDVLVRALDRILILHADHRTECLDVHRPSGRLVRRQSVCRIAAGIACLWGRRTVAPMRRRWR